MRGYGRSGAYSRVELEPHLTLPSLGGDAVCSRGGKFLVDQQI